VTPKDDYWDEILQQIDMDYIPLEYINTVIVTFQDGKQWEIDIEKSSNNIEDTENILDNFFKEYEDTIDTVDFRLDTEQLKNDINKRTKRFLKVNK
jgi:hypothetical protein